MNCRTGGSLKDLQLLLIRQGLHEKGTPTMVEVESPSDDQMKSVVYFVGCPFVSCPFVGCPFVGCHFGKLSQSMGIQFTNLIVLAEKPIYI